MSNFLNLLFKCYSFKKDTAFCHQRQLNLSLMQLYWFWDGTKFDHKLKKKKKKSHHQDFRMAKKWKSPHGSYPVTAAGKTLFHPSLNYFAIAGSVYNYHLLRWMLAAPV